MVAEQLAATAEIDELLLQREFSSVPGVHRVVVHRLHDGEYCVSVTMSNFDGDLRLQVFDKQGELYDKFQRLTLSVNVFDGCPSGSSSKL